MGKRKRFIGVLGPSKARAEIYQLAETVGYLVGKKGGILVSGGLAGVMEAAAKGAKRAWGITIGILPCPDKKQANPYVDFPIATGLGEARNLIIGRTADVLIAIGKSYGTLSEIAFALKMGKKVIGLATYPIEGIIKVNTPKEAVEEAFRGDD